MSDACPHCGRPLPAVVDAFCPECRRPLDELPPAAAGLGSSGPASARSLLGLLIAAGGLMEVFAAVVSGSRSSIADAVCTGVVGLAMVVVGLRMSASSERSEGFHKRQP